MKQHDLMRITKLVITPLGQIYGAYSREVSEMMIDDLADFDDATLRKAVERVRKHYKSQPRIAHIVEACHEVSDTLVRDTSEADKHYNDLKRRDIDAMILAKNFLDGYRVAGLAATALLEGWYDRLLAYAEQASLLQARYITNAINPGYTQGVFMRGKMTVAEMVFRCKSFVRQCKEQAGLGFIEVQVPSYLIDEWRAESEYRKRQAA